MNEMPVLGHLAVLLVRPGVVVALAATGDAAGVSTASERLDQVVIEPVQECGHLAAGDRIVRPVGAVRVPRGDAVVH